MSISKTELVEKARGFGIRNGNDIPYGQLEVMVRKLKNDPGDAPAPKAKNKKPVRKSVVKVSNARPVAFREPTPEVSADRMQREAYPAHKKTYLTKTGFLAEVYLDFIGEWRWRLVSNNSRIVGASSEGFNTKWGAKRNLKKVVGLK